MSKTINNLNQSLEEQLNLNELQDSVDNSLQTEAKSIVGAINEITGKQVISEAIGTPLTASDTWNNMEAKINGLLSTFKTNMMNNGVTVESGDRFKQLIDKIATMVEEGSSKGIQFAEGVISSITLPKAASYGLLYSFNNTLNFEPNILLVCLPNIYNRVTYNFVINSTIHNSSANKGVVLNYETPCYLYIDNNNDLYGYIASSATGTFSEVKWYAIGVGEEDTTLKDSLASILESNGVDVSDEDDMADLIGKVDEEFDRITAETSIMKTGTATVSNLYGVGTFTVNINPNFVPKEIICTITSFRFNYSSGSYTTITSPTVVYSKYNNTSSSYVTLSPRNGNYGADVYISSISQSNFVVTITRFTGYSIPSMSIEWIAIS